MDEKFFQTLKEQAEEIKKKYPERIPQVEAQVQRFINSRLAYKDRRPTCQKK